MVAVTIDLWPFGFADRARSLVAIAIWNTGDGNRVTSNYEYRISHQFDSEYGKAAAEKTKIEKPSAFDLALEENKPWIWKSGRIENFKRQKGAASLLAAVLKNAKL